MRKAMLAIATVMIGAGMAAAGPHSSIASFSPSQSAVLPSTPTTYVVSGTVANVTDTQLQLDRRVKGTNKTVTFVLTPATYRVGTPTKGRIVVVQYRVEREENIALQVEVEPSLKSAR